MAPAILALLTASLAFGQGESQYAQRFKRVGGELLKWTRNVDMRSTLPTARLLALQPPWEVPIKFFYSESPRVHFVCDGGGKIEAGDDTSAASRACGDDDTPGSYGAIFAGSNLWQYAMLEGKISDDRLAFALAHEIGHIRLKHMAQYWALYDDLYGKWMKAKGNDLRKWKLARELARYQAPSREDAARASADTDEYLQETFMEQNEDAFREWGRSREDEADEYAGRLAAAAGYDSGKMAGSMQQVEVFTFWLDFTTIDGKTPTQGSNPTANHSPALERDWRVMERYVLGSRRSD